MFAHNLVRIKKPFRKPREKSKKAGQSWNRAPRRLDLNQLSHEHRNPHQVTYNLNYVVTGIVYEKIVRAEMKISQYQEEYYQ